MRIILLLHGHRVFPHLMIAVANLEVENILRLMITHRKNETIYFHIPVDEHAVGARCLGGRDGHGVLQGLDVALQLVLGVSRVVERAVEGRTP